MRLILFIGLFLLAVSASAAATGDTAAVVSTGNFGVDMFGMRSLNSGPNLPAPQEGAMPVEGRKSPWIAAGLSAVVPGAGEFYAESYWKSALFFAVEVAAWGFAYSYDKQGDRQTVYFQDFADNHWSVVQYAQYAQAHLVAPGSQYNWLKPGTEGLAAWDRVNWSELNRMERDISATGLGQYYSHTLPPHGDQQYYEEIGKYQQYNQGWDDANPNLPPDYGSMAANITAHNDFYSGERAKANTYYERATTFVTVAILNHVASAIDAALTAGSYNRSLHARMGFQAVPSGPVYTRVPVLKLSLDI